MPKLGVNIDHVASVRELRHGTNPEPLFAAMLCEASGADSIVIHLREDRRHIKDRDVYILRKALKSKLNLEMSCADEIVAIACKAKPDQATLVPEKRKEVTTEGGLDVVSGFQKVKQVCAKLAKHGIDVSLFIDPDKKQIDASKKAGVRIIELHTGRFADARDKKKADKYFKELVQASQYAHKLGLTVNAGHGLDYNNAARVAGIKNIEELNIGYSIVCRAVLVGLGQAVREMKARVK
jgi:pyridoxine 5-phosphate synthase